MYTATIPATQLELGMILDDDRFAYAMEIGHLTVGPKWVTARAFHPLAPVAPNPAYRVAVGDTVSVRFLAGQQKGA